MRLSSGLGIFVSAEERIAHRAYYRVLMMHANEGYFGRAEKVSDDEWHVLSVLSDLLWMTSKKDNLSLNWIHDISSQKTHLQQFFLEYCEACNSGFSVEKFSVRIKCLQEWFTQVKAIDPQISNATSSGYIRAVQIFQDQKKLAETEKNEAEHKAARLHGNKHVMFKLTQDVGGVPVVSYPVVTI